eukprot:1140662-Pelagomonas_calceolata.AAC.1
MGLDVHACAQLEPLRFTSARASASTHRLTYAEIEPKCVIRTDSFTKNPIRVAGHPSAPHSGLLPQPLVRRVTVVTMIASRASNLRRSTPVLSHTFDFQDCTSRKGATGNACARHLCLHISSFCLTAGTPATHGGKCCGGQQELQLLWLDTPAYVHPSLWHHRT